MIVDTFLNSIICTKHYSYVADKQVFFNLMLDVTSGKKMVKVKENGCDIHDPRSVGQMKYMFTSRLVINVCGLTKSQGQITNGSLPNAWSAGQMIYLFSGKCYCISSIMSTLGDKSH